MPFKWRVVDIGEATGSKSAPPFPSAGSEVSVLQASRRRHRWMAEAAYIFPFTGSVKALLAKRGTSALATGRGWIS